MGSATGGRKWPTATYMSTATRWWNYAQWCARSRRSDSGPSWYGPPKCVGHDDDDSATSCDLRAEGHTDCRVEHHQRSGDSTGGHPLRRRHAGESPDGRAVSGQWRPVSPGRFSDPTINQSIRAGVIDLRNDTANDPAPVIFGFSQGAIVATEYKKALNTNPANTTIPTFVSTWNPNRPNGAVPPDSPAPTSRSWT